MDTLKWVLPLLISVAAFWKSFADDARVRRESSTRARQQYNAELRQWAKECIQSLSDAGNAVRCNEVNDPSLAETISKLSAQADQGRLFFPNPQADVFGQHKEDAFRGFRPRILDWLIFAFNICCSVKTVPDIEAARALVLMKRGFTADIQIAISPRNLYTTMEDLQELLSRGDFMETSLSHKNLLVAQQLIKSRKRQDSGDGSIALDTEP